MNSPVETASTTEAAKIYKVSVRQLFNLAKAKQIPPPVRWGNADWFGWFLTFKTFFGRGVPQPLIPVALVAPVKLKIKRGSNHAHTAHHIRS